MGAERGVVKLVVMALLLALLGAFITGLLGGPVWTVFTLLLVFVLLYGLLASRGRKARP